MRLREVVKKLPYPIQEPLRYIYRTGTWSVHQFLNLKVNFFEDKVQGIPLRGVNNILIYGYMGIGNMILFTPTIRAIKNRFPRAHITLLVGNNAGCEEVITGSSLVGEIINFKLEKTNIFEKIRFIKMMKARRFDLLISEFHGAGSFLGLLTALSNIPYRIGHSTSPGWKNKYDYVYNYKVEMANNEHEIDRDLRLAYAVGIKEDEVDKNPIIWISEEDREYARGFLNRNNVCKQGQLIGVQVGTSPAMRWKQWNLKKYSQLCDRLIENYGIKIVLLGSQNETELTNYVREKMKYSTLIATGKTTVKQAAAIIERCKIFICNDSGLMHVSAAVGTPVVAIYGPTDYHRTFPYGAQHIMVRKGFACSPCFRMEGTEKAENCTYDYKCLKSITVDEVYEVVTNKLRCD